MKLPQIETLLLQDMENIIGGGENECECTNGGAQQGSNGKCICFKGGAMQLGTPGQLPDLPPIIVCLCQNGTNQTTL